MLKISNTGQYGLINDYPDEELPINAWTSGQNVRIQDGTISNAPGHNQVFDPPSVTPYWCFPVPTASAYYWFYWGLAKAYVTDGTSHFDITRYTTTPGDNDYTAAAGANFTGGVLGGVPVFNNGTNIPQMWNPVSTGQVLQALSNWTATHKCQALRPFKNYLIALDITKGSTRFPQMVKWSDSADPGTVPGSWDETDSTIDAGEYSLSDTAGFCVDGLALKDSFIIYKEDSTYAMRYIGGQFIFSFSKLFENDGMLAANCGVEHKGLHYVLTRGDFIVHDGHSITSRIDQKNRRWLFQSIDTDNYQKSFVVANPKKEEIWICYPTTGNTFCNQAFVYRINEDAWSVRDLPNVTHIAKGIIEASESTTWDTDAETWADDLTTWDQRLYNPSELSLMMASTDTKLYEGAASNTDNGTVKTCFIERVGLTHINNQTPDLSTVKLIHGLWPRFEADSGTQIDIYISTKMHVSDSETWHGPYTFTVGTDEKIDCLVTGRIYGIKFQTQSDVEWRFMGCDIDIKPAGRL